MMAKMLTLLAFLVTPGSVWAGRFVPVFNIDYSSLHNVGIEVGAGYLPTDSLGPFASVDATIVGRGTHVGIAGVRQEHLLATMYRLSYFHFRLFDAYQGFEKDILFRGVELDFNIHVLHLSVAALSGGEKRRQIVMGAGLGF